MKKKTLIIIISLLMVVAITIPIFGAIMWNVTAAVHLGHAYNDATGMATVTVYIQPYYYGTVYDINVYLEKNNGSTWDPVASWTGLTGTATDFRFTDTTTNVHKNYTYRIHVTGTVTYNGVSDNLDQTGLSKIY